MRKSAEFRLNRPRNRGLRLVSRPLRPEASSEAVFRYHSRMRRSILAAVLLAGCTARMQTDPLADDRARMVEQQIQARGVADPRVLTAMRTVLRHRFVDASQAASAYDDRPLPIGHGQTISQPYIVAYMIELLRLAPGAKGRQVI